MMNTGEICKIFLVVISYWFISISLVFANKFLVGNPGESDISLFVSWTQCMATVLIGGIIGMIIGFINPQSYRWGSIIDPKLYSRDILPLVKMSFCFVFMLAFNNMCLRQVGVSFYQVARSMTIIFVVIFSVIILKRSVSKSIIICCLLVAGGFFLGVSQEGAMKNFSARGVVYGVISSIFIALTGIYTKQALPIVEKNELKLTVWTNLMASLIFVPLLFLNGEYSTILNSTRLTGRGDFWVFLAVSSLLGFGISWISAVQINVTSPISHHISANCKAILQTILAVIYYQETKSVMWWFSVCLIVGGACAYAIRRYKEEESLKISDQTTATAENTDPNAKT